MKLRMPLLALLAAMPARAATVVVDVRGVHGTHGHILVALCTQAEFLQPHCQWQGAAPAQPGTVQITIKDVPPGLYAAQAFHDANDNRKLDRNFFGLPREAMGFSNNAPIHMRPPRFDAAAFNVAGDHVEIAFSVKYFD